MNKPRDTNLRLPAFARPPTVKENVYRILRDQLTHGDMRPNQRIVEKDLTEQLGVSRTPVREALARLATEGLLVATRRGYRVPAFTIQDIINLSEIRLLLEPQAAKQAAANETDAGLAEMRKAITEEITAHANDDINGFLQAHMHFRAAWMQRVSNPLLLETLAKTIHSLHLIRRWTMSDPVMRAVMIEAHRALLRAVEARDPARAHEVQTRSIRKFKAHVLKKMKA
ncbi:MAG: GntR family transcriptional regulator [Betaproteobacteria bacterium]|nr:MAG: GntR family transcriptional regulator [Betaproteobacteria bacterium]